MWSGGDDVNEEGEAVRVYHPIIYGRKPDPNDLTCSFIGGDTADSSCLVCQQPLKLLVQLHIPNASVDDPSRTLRVFACNRASCIQSLFKEGDGKLSYGGGGVVRCRRLSVTPDLMRKEDYSTEITTFDTSEENDWTVDSGGDMDDLEAKLAAVETSKQTLKTKPQSAPRKNKTKSCLPCYELSALQEPGCRRTEGMDDDDVGLSGGDKDDKIQQMLARYMAEEEDEDILSALRGAAGGGNGGGGGRGERDERLSAEDRALLSFSDRFKRSPRQVLRYAYGGVPLWSIPIASRKEQQNAKQSKKKSKSKILTVEKPIPHCNCGAPLVFELQVLPSILHVLEVDKYATGDGSIASGLDAAYAEGGMDFGNIAIYSCSAACSSAEEEYVVVQESVDDRPTQPRHVMSDEPVVIQENATFDDNDDDNDQEEDMEDEEEC